MTRKARQAARKRKQQQRQQARWIGGIVVTLLVLAIIGYLAVASSKDDDQSANTTLASQSNHQTSNTSPIAYDDPRFPIAPASGTIFDQGKTLYEQYCAACHGINGEGQQPDPYARGMAPPHTDDGHTWHHPDQQNFTTVWQGRDIAGNMPGFSDRMTPDEIISVLAYIKTWWSEDSLQVQTQATRAAAGG